jgi:hypothetical protein
MCILRNWVGGVSLQFPELLGLQPEAVYEFTLFLASNYSSCHRPEYPHGMEGKENKKKQNEPVHLGRTAPHRVPRRQGR